MNYPKIDLKMETWVLNLPPTCILVFFQGQGRIRRGVYNLMVFDFFPPPPPSFDFLPHYASRQITKSIISFP